MDLPMIFWLQRFALQALVWTIGILAMAAIAVGLVYPASRWLFADGWQWMPFEKRVKFLLVCIPGGILCGGLFTLCDWLEHGDADLVLKVVVSSIVISSIVLICIVLGPRTLFLVIPFLAKY
jgi:hypothetical protein